MCDFELEKLGEKLEICVDFSGKLCVRVENCRKAGEFARVPRKSSKKSDGEKIKQFSEGKSFPCKCKFGREKVCKSGRKWFQVRAESVRKLTMCDLAEFKQF